MTIKNTKGETMSASNGGRVRSRLSLLAGSSLAAAGLTAFGGAALAPTAAMAQATCVPAPASGNGTNTVTYNAGTYNPGITCAYVGAGATVSTAGAITVSSTAGGNGINLSAAGADAVNWVSTAGTVTAGAQTGGPVIDATSVSGPINITTAAVTGTQISVTHGIQAVSTGGGAVSVTNTAGNVNINSSTDGAQQQSAIRAVSTGGNGAVSVSTAGTVTGRLRGIEAQASGTGALTITATGAVGVNTTAGVGVAAIDARTGTGLLTINVNTGGGLVTGQTGNAILTNAGGSQVINVAAGRIVQASASPATMDLTSVGAITVNNAGRISRTGLTGAESGVAIAAAGSSFTLTNSGALVGRLNLAGVTGASTVNSTGTWSTGNASAFGAGTSILNNAGTLTAVGPTTFTSLEQFNNSGTIVLETTATLAGPGTAFTGSGASRLAITTPLDPAGSTACNAGVAGCLDLTDGTTAGVTTILLTVDDDDSNTVDDLNTSRFSPNPIVVVDVTGGTSAASHFVLDPTTAGYIEDPNLGGALGTPGLFAYALRYNADTRQHLLISAPRADAFEFSPIIHEALSSWHAAADVVAGRQADLGAGASGGGWVRVAMENSDRELVQSFTSGGNTFTADNGYSLETGTAIAGFDLVKDGVVVLGVHGGFVRSKMAFDHSATRDELRGPAVGAYGGWRAGAFSLDGAFNLNMLELQRTAPTFEDAVTNIVSLGGRAEAGWKLGERFFIQPLVTAAYVTTRVEDVEPTGYDIVFEDVESSRAAVGLRAGGETGPLRLWAVARAWKEFSGDGAVSISNARTATGVTFADDLSGDFQEVGVGLSLSNESDSLSGFISGGARFAEGIDNHTASVGLRLRW